MKKLLHVQSCSALLFALLLSKTTQAQFTLQGQLRTRTEVRDGLGNLAKIGYVLRHRQCSHHHC